MLSAFGSIVGRDGLRLAKAARRDSRQGNPLLRKKISDAVGAAFGELLVEIVRADAVRMAFNLKRESGMREQDAGNLRELLASARFQRGAAGVEENVGHVDDEPPGAVTSL